MTAPGRDTAAGTGPDATGQDRTGPTRPGTAGPVFPGRFTVPPDRGVVVFLIGMRINRLTAVRAWVPVVRAMSGMLAELARRPDAGLLAARSFVSGRTVLVRQYWTDPEHLLAYAGDRDSEHLPAWRRFNQAARSTGGAVGIFHETYVAGPGRMECIAVDMPASGVMEALGAVPVTPARGRARDRLGDVPARDGGDRVPAPA